MTARGQTHPARLVRTVLAAHFACGCVVSSENNSEPKLLPCFGPESHRREVVDLARQALFNQTAKKEGE